MCGPNSQLLETAVLVSVPNYTYGGLSGALAVRAFLPPMYLEISQSDQSVAFNPRKTILMSLHQ